MTFALPGAEGSYFVNDTSSDAFMHQEMIEILYHTLWETVHVFFEHRELGHDVGEAGFLYPFLGQEKQLRHLSDIPRNSSQQTLRRATR